SAQLRIAETMALLEGTGRTFAWWVGPTSTPADLAARLTDAGLPVSEHEAAMWAPISRTPAAPAPADLEVRPVASGAELADFAAVVAANWEPPAPTIRQFYAVTAPQALATGGPARDFVRYHKEWPLCTGEIFLPRDVCGVHCVAASC